MSNYQVSCCCPSGGGGGLPAGFPPFGFVHPISLEYEGPDLLVSSAGTVFPPQDIFLYNRQVAIPQSKDLDPLGVPWAQYTATPTSGKITINRTGQYEVTMTSAVIIENESVPTLTKLAFWLVNNQGPGPVPILRHTTKPSGQDTDVTTTATRIINVDTVPYELDTMYSVIDPAPTENVYVSGSAVSGKNVLTIKPIWDGEPQTKVTVGI